MALTGTTSGNLHPGSGARGIVFGPSSSSNEVLYTCPAGKIAYISAGAYLKVDGVTFPHWATGGATTATRTVPFYVTSGQVITASSSGSSQGIGIEFDA